MKTVQAQDEQPRQARNQGRPPRLWRTVLASVEGRLGLAAGTLVLALIVVGPFAAPYDPTALETGPPSAGPSSDHILGTDQLGRDVLSRFLSGGSATVLVPFAAVSLSFVVGGTLGLLGAYRRGSADAVITRGFDLVIALPGLLIVLVLVTALGSSWYVIALVIAALFTPRAGRIVRGAAQAVVTHDYIAAAQARGESTPRILLSELLPNAAAPIIASYSLFLTYGVVAVSTLSYLGLGAQPPSSDWGLTIAESRGLIAINPWPTLAPALAIAALSVAFTLIGDAITGHLARDTEQSALR